jgi:hypothetical protein
VFAELLIHHLGCSHPAPVFPGYQVAPDRFAGIV